jgi:hypothetical protein
MMGLPGVQWAGRHGRPFTHVCMRGVCAVGPASSDVGFSRIASQCARPLIPPAPFSLTGSRGSRRKFRSLMLSEAPLPLRERGLG